MIVGSGDISSALIDNEEITFFASGVSDSSCSSLYQFEREEKLLKQQPRKKHLVYFSTLAIYYNWNPYVAHKKRMELLVKDLFESYTIVRIGNISWGNNPNTLINYLKAHPEAEIRNVYRHIIDKDEFQYWMGLIKPGERNEMNVPGKMVWVPTLAENFKRGINIIGSKPVFIDAESFESEIGEPVSCYEVIKKMINDQP